VSIEPRPSQSALAMLARAGASVVLLVAIMFAGGILPWVAIPLGWLWIGSQVQGATDSLGAALATMMVGVLGSIALMVPVLTWLSNRHRQARVAGGHEDTGHLVLEIVMVTSAGVAVIGFTAWFLLFAGASPIPVGIGL